MARKFAQKYAVALLARNPANYEPLVKEIEAAGGKAIGISTDCSDAASTKKAFEQLKSAMGGAKLTAAIYNVGGRFVRKPFLELSEEDFVAGFEANGYICFFLRCFVRTNIFGQTRRLSLCASMPATTS